FRPEFLNRLSETPIIFRHLERKDLKLVIDFELAKIRERLSERGFELTLTNEAKDFLIKKGTDLEYGARPLRRALENYVEDTLSEELLKGNFQGKNRIMVDGVENDKGKITRLKFDSEFVPPPEEPPQEEAVGVGVADDDSGDDSPEKSGTSED
ncbi:NDP-hexose 4-ketoreductase, partial [bacterium]|nr:NDP-hexose 4-ketoreductase [bacterium]